MTVLDLASPLGRRVAEHKGVIESGMLANMRLYRIDYRARIHTRIVGEDRTLCGKSLRHNDQWAWQFIHRGNVLDGHMPSGSDTDHWRPGHAAPCQSCEKSPVLQATKAISKAQRQAVAGIIKGRR